GAPDPRSQHVAVWTGSQMVVWGGLTAGGPTASGGIYDPVKRTWVPTSLANAPPPSYDASAVWTGSGMIVWGGHDDGGPLATGGIFDPATNTWSTLTSSGAPSPRHLHTAVWATEQKVMLIWGGRNDKNPLDDGRSYDVTAGTWSIVAGEGPPARD